jgi:NADH:ubiquinone oxidoreductase subunit 2 (subunit N)
MVAAAYVLFALGAALRAPDGTGLQAMAFQAGVVLLAAALGWLSLKPGGAGPGKGLAAVALFIAWLSLLGLPPTAGFHARVLVYRSLLQAGWSGTLVFALAVGAAALVPAFGALALGCPGSVRGGRGFLVILLICALVASGLYPELGLSVASSLAGSR